MKRGPEQLPSKPGSEIGSTGIAHVHIAGGSAESGIGMDVRCGTLSANLLKITTFEISILGD